MTTRPWNLWSWCCSVFFKLPHEQAVQVMLKVHTEGAGVCGVFTAEVAETRVREVLGLASENEHPLQCTMEPE